jgi:HSP20 family protein
MLPSLWNDDDNWMSPLNINSGISISQDDKHIYVSASLPGVNPKDVEVNVEDDYVWIKGEVEQEEEDKKKQYLRRALQSFSYRVAVPGDVDQNVEPEATSKHGVMTIKFAKSPKAAPKKITVKSV